jgi:hypothetical protein
MSKKKIGLIVGVVGIVLLLLATVINKKLDQARAGVAKGKSLFSDNLVSGMVGDIAESKIGRYQAIANVATVGGILCVVVGGGMYFWFRKKR